ncbi:phage tail tube protein [Gryllotalpicola koreensis]|uniref:Uncharacterized protein n=1 Tax=Gryllotalpicola koreensis TaxID=993086 RepID=A0ABP8A377_9MICO
MTQPADIAPTQGDMAFAYETIWDIAPLPEGGLSAITEASWQNVPDITGLNPSAPPTTQDNTTYANKGNPSTVKIGETFTLAVNVSPVRDTAGEFQPELITLIEAAESKGIENVIAYRYYDYKSAAFAFRGTARVEYTLANTGATDQKVFAFTLTGTGDREKISNPALAAAGGGA